MTLFFFCDPLKAKLKFPLELWAMPVKALPGRAYLFTMSCASLGAGLGGKTKGTLC